MTKKHSCELCGVSFDRIGHLREHFKTAKHKSYEECANKSPIELMQEIRLLQRKIETFESGFEERVESVFRKYAASQVNEGSKGPMVTRNTNCVVNTTIDNRVDNSVVHNTVVNINLRPFGDENWSYITDDIVLPIMKQVNSCIPEMIKMIHFNADHPENHNIRMPNKKLNQIKVFDGEQWATTDKNEAIDNIVSGIVDKLETTYEAEFKKRATLFIQRLWEQKIRSLVYSEDTRENKRHNREMRSKVEYCILDNQKRIKTPQSLQPQTTPDGSAHSQV